MLGSVVDEIGVRGTDIILELVMPILWSALGKDAARDGIAAHW